MDLRLLYREVERTEIIGKGLKRIDLYGCVELYVLHDKGMKYRENP